MVQKYKGKIQCPKCPKTFSKIYNLKRHFPVHTGHFKFWCDTCQRGFTQKALHEDHMRKHEGRLYKCEYCIKSYQTRTSLYRHLPEHTGKYPHYCLTCGAGFVVREELKLHENKHRGLSTKIQCPKCPKTFTKQRNLKRHSSFHTGLFRFLCNVCQKGFNEKATYTHHMRKHNDKLLSCRSCSKSFQSSFAFQQHLKTHRGNLVSHGEMRQKTCDNRRDLNLDENNGSDYSCLWCDQKFCDEKIFKKHEQECQWECL